MSAFRISIAGQDYIGIFTSQQAAAADAEARYPDAWPPQVRCLGGVHA
jgi:hypothetical protein